MFATLAEGVKGKRAVEWGLVDELIPRSRFREVVEQRAREMATQDGNEKGAPIPLESLAPRVTEARIEYQHVLLDLARAQRTAALTVSVPEAADALWALRAFREIDDALLRLRFHYPEIGLVLLETRGSLDTIMALDHELNAQRCQWPANEILLLMARTLRRLDQTAKSFFAVVNRGSCFGGCLLELALAADRIYMLDDAGREVCIGASPLNGGLLPMTHGLSRLAVRFLNDPKRAEAVLVAGHEFDTADASDAGLVTAAVDEIDWEDELRVAIEERASLSPDALTGMEASLRLAGPENCASKIFGRLSAWQNWVFSRPNATGEHGALPLYGKPERPQFDWRRT